MKKLYILLAAITAVCVAQAQPFYVSGDFNGWTSPSTNVMTGSGPYSCAINGQTPGGLNQLKVSSSGWASSWPANNVTIKWDATGSNTVYYLPGSFSDGWTPGNDRVGYADPGVPWEIIGSFNGWDASQPANTQMTSNGSGLYSVTYVVTNAGSYTFQFRHSGTWSDLQSGVDFMNKAQDIPFTTAVQNQSVQFQLDIPNGRYRIVIPPVTNQVVFAVDMSSQIQLGKFDPSVDSVYASGAFNGWPGINPGALVLTNYPTYNGGSNPNIYYATNQFIGLPGGSSSGYKFTCSNPADSGNNGYEPRGSDRSFNLLGTNGTLLLPVVSFGDVYTSDFLSADTTVTFSVNMNGAHNTYGTNFDGSQAVYLTGDFDDNGWAPSPWKPSHLRQMNENPIGSGIYTWTQTVQAGKTVVMHYKYGFDDGVNALDNEAPAFQDHSRVIRLTAGGSYTLPQDTFGDQHVEPNFNMVSVTPAGANVTVKWLGRPGVMLQSASSLTGTWTTNTATDGGVWTGSTTPMSDGTACITNVPASSKGFFRLIKPN
jgi:hypothetical protein